MDLSEAEIEKKCAPCLGEGINCDLDLGEGMTCAQYVEMKKCEPCFNSGKDCDAKMQMPGIGEIACSDMMGTDPVQLHFASFHTIPHRDKGCTSAAAFSCLKFKSRKCYWLDFKCHKRNLEKYAQCVARKKRRCKWDGLWHGCAGKTPCTTQR